ncbi:MAG: helicase HerA-like domain-containing protein, partial [Mailhella sp.]
GVYFITQNPADIPETILSQLGNRIQHALRAFTPREQKAVRAAAETFRQNPSFNTKEAIASLRTGEALVSFLDAKGSPSMVERALILPPEGDIGPLNDSERAAIISRSPMQRLYGTAIDRESAHEILTGQENSAISHRKVEPSSPWDSMVGSVVKQAGRTISTTVGRELGRAVIRGILGGIFGKRR